MEYPKSFNCTIPKNKAGSELMERELKERQKRMDMTLDLHKLIGAWRNLSDEIQREIMNLVEPQKRHDTHPDLHMLIGPFRNLSDKIRREIMNLVEPPKK